jgi:PUA domain protein
MEKLRKYKISTKESKGIIDDAMSRYPQLSSLITKRKTSLEVVDLGEAFVYLYNGLPVLVRKENFLIPFIGIIDKYGLDIPKITVDLGAVKFILNGADVMGPGVKDVDERIKEGDIVRVVAEEYNKTIALGISLRNSDKIKERGKSVRNIHYLGDRIWKSMREHITSDK